MTIGQDVSIPDRVVSVVGTVYFSLTTGSNVKKGRS